MTYTSGFGANRLADHFARHGDEVGAATEHEYEALADAFVGGPLGPETIEVARINDKSILRYNPVTNEFGVLAANRVIRTYFKPDPGTHGLANNLDFFEHQCIR